MYEKWQVLRLFQTPPSFPETTGLPEGPPGQALQKNETREKWGHLLKADAADEREGTTRAEERSKLRFRLMLTRRG